jgi:prefoldin subunit 5
MKLESIDYLQGVIGNYNKSITETNEAIFELESKIESLKQDKGEYMKKRDDLAHILDLVKQDSNKFGWSPAG